jgi:hypothetical protein
MQSASDTPSSHLWAQSCPADQRGVGCGWDRRANPGTKGRRPARVPAARDRPAGYHERRRDSPRFSCASAKRIGPVFGTAVEGRTQVIGQRFPKAVG